VGVVEDDGIINTSNLPVQVNYMNVYENMHVNVSCLNIINLIKWLILIHFYAGQKTKKNINK